jgi:hypothetical protein
MMGEAGDDTFVISELCEAAVGEHVMGGEGFDRLETALTLDQLEEVGVELHSIEQIVVTLGADNAACKQPKPDAIPSGSDAERLCGVLAQTAAVVEGTVDSRDEQLDELPGYGPREVAVLSDVVVRLGELTVQTDTLKIRSMGGPIPSVDDDGMDYIDVDHVPILTPGERYVFFLRNTSWRFSPVAWDYIYRRDNIGGSDVLVHQSGHVVSSVVGGRVSGQAFDRERREGPSEEISTPDGLDAAPTPAAYLEALEDFAADCPEEVLQGVFSPFPTGVWNEFGTHKPDILILP